MYPLLVIFSCLLLAIRASAQDNCRFSAPFHEVFSAPEGVLTIDDEDGSRQIKGTIFNSPNCQLNARALTGSSFGTVPNMTLMASNDRDPNGCEFSVTGSEYSIDSFQAVIIETNGWPLNDLTFNISDVDSSRNLGRDAAAVFGVRDGELVLPNMTFNEDTLLRLQNFVMSDTSINQLGLSLGTITVPGVVLADPANSICSNVEPRAGLCRTIVSFSVPVDTVVTIYTMEERGTIPNTASVYLSPINTACGCRCRENNPGPRQLTVPVSGSPGECTMKEASGPKSECDVLGGRWCLKESDTTYGLTGNTLPNGNLECTEGQGIKIAPQQDFTPDPSFGGSI